MRALPLSALTIGIVAWAAVVSADPIRILSDLRSVQVLADLNDSIGNVISERDTQFSRNNLVTAVVGSLPGQQASARATLSSTLTGPHSFSGVGATRVVVTTPGDSRTTSGAGFSRFDVSFQLETAQRFSFRALFNGAPDFIPGAAFADSTGSAGLGHAPDFNNGPFFQFLVLQGSQLIRERGFLQPGSYDFFVQQVSGGTAFGSDSTTMTTGGEVSFTFDLAPTPEPASLILLGSGVLGLVHARRRRRPAECRSYLDENRLS